MPTAAPHADLPAEQALLGAVLISRTAHGDVRSSGLADTDFFKPLHAEAWRAVETLDALGEPVDAVTVAGRMHRDGRDTLDILTGWVQSCPAVDHAGAHARQVISLARRRRRLTALTAARKHTAAGDDTAAAEVLAAIDVEDSRLAVTGLVTDWTTITAGEQRTADLLGCIDSSGVTFLCATPGTGKTWMMLAACVEIVQTGRRALIIDGENTPETTLSRLRRMIDPARLTDQLSYLPIGDWQRLTSPRRLALLDGITLLCIDSASATGCGVTDDDFAAWHDLLIAPARTVGAGVLVIDHPRKRAAGEDRLPTEPRGSGRKTQTADQVLHVTGQITSRREIDSPGGRRIIDGTLRVGVNKDRHAAIPSITDACAGHWRLMDDMATGGGLVWILDPDTGPASITTGDQEDTPVEPPDVVQQVAEFVADNPGATTRQIRDGIEAANSRVDAAIRHARDRGLIRVDREGPGRPNRHHPPDTPGDDDPHLRLV